MVGWDPTAILMDLEDSYIEEVMGEGKDIFERGFKFAFSKASKEFDITDQSVQREEYQSAYLSNQ